MPYQNIDKQREYKRRWTANRRHEFFKDKTCKECGTNKDLELDHIDPKSKISHSIWSWSKERREKEIEKCQVLCHNCHLKKTIVNQDNLMYGENNGLSKFYNKDVLNLFKDYNNGINRKKLIIKYNTTKQNISKILNGKTWNKITGISKK